MHTNNILVIVGSLRKESVNKAVAEALKASAPAGTTIEIADLSSIPLYNQDLESSFPQPVLDLKEKIRAAQGIVIVTPEYNRSIPGMLKNLIDWTSRPYGDSAWAKKPVATIGASVGPTGTAFAQAHLRTILIYLDTYLMGQPEIYIGNVGEKIKDGSLTDAGTLDHLKGFLEKFIQHTNTVSKTI